MKIGSIFKQLPTLLKMVGLGKIDIKEEINKLPNSLVDMINSTQKQIDSDLTTSILAVKNENEDLVLIPIGFNVENNKAVIQQELEPINVTQLIRQTDLEKLADLMDDENSKLSFLEKLEAARVNRKRLN